MKPFLDRHSAFFNLKEALERPGCPVCKLQAYWTEKQIETILYESVNDKFFRSRLAKTEGFCATHAWRIADFNSSLGSAILFRDRLDRLTQRLETKKIKRMKGLQPCLLCQNEAEAEKRYLQVLAGAFADPAFQEQFAASSGLCFPHLEAVLPMLSSSRRSELLSIQREKYSRLSQELEAYIAKFDYRSQDRNCSEEEKNRWKEAIAVCSKVRNVI